MTYAVDDFKANGMLEELTVYFGYHADVSGSSETTAAKIEVSADGTNWQQLNSSNTTLRVVKNGDMYAGRFGLVEQKVTSVPDGVKYVRITMNPIAWPWYGRIYNVDLRIS